MNQTVLDRAVNLATKAALNGKPVARVTWIPPRTGTDDPGGLFAVEYAPVYNATETPIWEKS